MGFVEATKTCLSKYFTFSGRASRSEFWWFIFFICIVTLVLAFLDSVVFGVDPKTGETSQFLTGLFELTTFFPTLSVSWRRLHDTGRPGWYSLLPIVPAALAGGLYFSADIHELSGILIFAAAVLAVLVTWWYIRPSDSGANIFGAPPN